MKINENRKSIKRKGKPMLASDITMIQLKNPVTETQTMNVRNFTRRAHIPYIIKKKSYLDAIQYQQIGGA